MSGTACSIVSIVVAVGAKVWHRRQARRWLATRATTGLHVIRAHGIADGRRGVSEGVLPEESAWSLRCRTR